MGAPLIYCNNSKPMDVFKPFKFIMSRLYNLDIKFKENHNEFMDAIFETPKHYEKLVKRKSDAMEVFGFIRESLENRYYVQDIIYIIVRYYVDLEKWMNVANKKLKKRKKRKRHNGKHKEKINGNLLVPQSSRSWSTDVSDSE